MIYILLKYNYEGFCVFVFVRECCVSIFLKIVNVIVILLLLLLLLLLVLLLLLLLLLLLWLKAYI